MLRTFLFITNEGTPEGEALARLTGLQKQDKQYLAIGKLSTFMNAKLFESEEFCRLLKSVGCGGLIGLYKASADFAKNQSKEAIHTLLFKYIDKSPQPESPIVEEPLPIPESAIAP